MSCTFKEQGKIVRTGGIPSFGGKPARGLPTPPPTPPRREIAHLTRGECASAMRGRDFYSRNLLAEGGGGNAKRCHSSTDHRISCKLKPKIANTILLLCYLDKMCQSPSGGHWQATHMCCCGRLPSFTEVLTVERSVVD